ncbi:Tad domain-containing protein [Sphingosinicella sp. YJ22]|uniref:Tad domain-containing protein n=1 Tax=Sphingosinicella sp. YJ22 TaxID=1104780 RepID=UPI001FAE93FD|nr:Tad domain-containing protein [Sphingosinicella sp. YJ22]
MTDQPIGGGVLRRLARDKKGNTLAIVGAALVPLTAMIGSGVDMSRAYMAKARLQSACDAAALAGRRVMTGDQMSTAVNDEAQRFFNFNFRQGQYQTAAFTPVVARSGPGTIRVTAATTIPTTIMRLFGYTTLPLNVTCDASLNFVNTDVMLVLDTTGSMLCTPEESGNCGRTSEITTSRIRALREAVLALYDALAPTQAQLEAAGMRLRFGIVPYSSTVNVGSLLNPGHVASSVEYQTRVPIYVQSQSTQTINNVNSGTCNSYRQDPPVEDVTFPVTGRTVSHSNGTCTVTTRQYDRPATATFGFWYYERSAQDTSGYKTFANNVALPTRTPGTNQTADVWNGCIEERATTSAINPNSGMAIPGQAADLNINLVPNSEETRWRPQWAEVEYFRGDAGGNLTNRPSRVGARYDQIAGEPACPASARRLQAWTRTNIQNYVNGLRAEGSTYHDVGMIWGARMISNAGVFADSPDTHANMPVARHIIFMTDGELAPSNLAYSAYGIEYMDQRITGNGAANAQHGRHMQRFRMICNAARSLNAQIWVIAFGTNLTAELRQCASSNDHASTSGNRAQLIQRFTEIGQNIGSLRLTR